MAPRPVPGRAGGREAVAQAAADVGHAGPRSRARTSTRARRSLRQRAQDELAAAGVLDEVGGGLGDDEGDRAAAVVVEAEALGQGGGHGRRASPTWLASLTATATASAVTHGLTSTA